VSHVHDVIDGVPRFLITAVVHAWVVALLVAIVLANAYAIVHAWRSGRYGWLAIILFTGGGIATGAYLVTYHDEPLPSGSARWA
jgi:hypothetical protein